MKTFVGTKPVLQTIIDPAMKPPEHRVDVRRKRVAQKIVFRHVPACREVCRIPRQGHRRAVGGVTWHRRPAHVQPVMQAQLYLRAELTQGQRRQVARVPITRLPDLEVAVIRLGLFDVTQPLGIGVIALCQPGRRQGAAIMVVEITGKPGTVAFKLGLRHRERRPRRQVLH